MLSPTQAILIFASALAVPLNIGSTAVPHNASDRAVDTSFFHVERIESFSPFLFKTYTVSM